MLSDVEKDIMRKGLERKFDEWDCRTVMEDSFLRSIMIDGYKQVIDDIFELQKETDLTLREILGEELCEGLVRALRKREGNLA